MKEETEKAGLKLNIQKLRSWHDIQAHHFMANRWGNKGNSERLIFLGSKITADGNCSHEIKRCLLFGRKAMTNLDSVLKSRDITLLTKVFIVKAMGFPVVMYGWELDHKESWAPKNWCFWTVMFGKNLSIPWTARRSKQSILKEISPEYSLEGLMLKFQLQYCGHLMWRTDSLEKALILKKTEGRRKGEWQDEMVGWHHWLSGHEFEQAPGGGEGHRSLVCCSPRGHKESEKT